MNRDEINFYGGILGLALGIFGLVIDKKFLAILGGLLVFGALLLFSRFRTESARKRKSTVQVEGLSIDALNVANLRREINKSLEIQEASHSAEIRGLDLVLTFTYAGICSAKNGEVGMLFSIDSESPLSFSQLECFGHDLLSDPQRKHRIKPVLVGSDGLSKKVQVPFAAPLEKNDRFAIELQCALPGVMRYGVDYYISTLSFRQRRNVKKYYVNLRFTADPPEWVRAYEVTADGFVKLVRDLPPSSREALLVTYADDLTNSPSESARIYLFCRRQASKSTA